MGLLDRAKNKAKEQKDKPAKKSTTWLVGNHQGDAVAKAITALKELNATLKATAAKMELQKSLVKRYADGCWMQQYSIVGVPPETPMVVQNADGEQVTFVVQDRSAQYNVDESRQEQLAQLLGEDAIDELLYEETQFALNRVVMAIPGVVEAVEIALEEAVKKLTGGKKPVLSGEQADQLIEVTHKTAFKPGTLDRLALICGKDVNRMAQLVSIMGSSATRYIRIS